MNREIEFRAWDVENKIMVYDNENDTYGYWDGCQDSDLGMINHLLNRKEYIFMQYTGLKDKNGKKIFEGDIIDISYDEAIIKNAVIEYHGASFYACTNSDMWELDNYFDIEAIGNIYENNLESKGE